MTTQFNSSRGMHILVNTAAFVIIIAGIYLAQSVVVLLLVSVFLALLGTTPLLWLKEKHVPSTLAVLIVVTSMMIILILIGAQTVTSFSSFSDELPLLQSSIREQVIELSVFLRSKGFSGTQRILLDYINPEAVMDLTTNLLSGLSSVISDLVLILLTVTFILLEVSSFPKKLRTILGDPERVFPRFTKFVVDMKRYMIIKTIINLAAGILIALWMYILGVQFPVLWGFLAFLLHYIPNIGAVIAVIPAAFWHLFNLELEALCLY